LDSRHTQIALENAKQRIAGSYLSVLQKVEDCGKRLRLCFRIDCFSQVQVFDVAWSGDRKSGADGKVPAVGSTVDVASATWTNTIGRPGTDYRLDRS
jgi:hypothetical protein